MSGRDLRGSWRGEERGGEGCVRCLLLCYLMGLGAQYLN